MFQKKRDWVPGCTAKLKIYLYIIRITSRLLTSGPKVDIMTDNSEGPIKHYSRK